MMKAFGVIGYHHSGKTTVATALIAELGKRGYRVATIKDIHHQDYHADTLQTNTWKHLQAGAEMVFAKGLHDSSLIFRSPLALADIIPLLSCDYLIIEGMKDAPVPKIVCAETPELLKELLDDTCVAVSGKLAASHSLPEYPPVFEIPRQTEALCNLMLVKTFDLLPVNEPECCSECGLTCYQMAAEILKGTKKRSDCLAQPGQNIILTVNDRQIPIVPFVQRLLRDNILSFLGNLKGTDTSGKIRIEIN